MRRPPPVSAFALVAGLAVYGLFSSPTPDHPGWAELAAALLLLVAVGAGRALSIGAGGWMLVADARAWQIVGTLALVLLFWGPALIGVVAGASAPGIVRDALPLLFLFVPLFLAGPAARSERAGGWRDGDSLAPALTVGLALVGLLFAGRFFLVSGATPGEVRALVPSDGLLYLANSPAVVFAAIALPLGAIEHCLDNAPGRRLVKAGSLLAGLLGGALCLAALAATLQRAALAMVAMAVAIYVVRLMVVRPASRLPLFAGGVALWVAAGPLLVELTDLLILKTALVGFNQHGAEIAVAVDLARASVGQFLVGGGWGLLLETPAVPGYRVGYLHGLPLYMLVKTGALGVLVLFAYLGALAAQSAPRLWRRSPALCLAVLAPLVIGLVIQPSFKYLGFGLILGLLVLAGSSETTRSISSAAKT